MHDRQSRMKGRRNDRSPEHRPSIRIGGHVPPPPCFSSTAGKIIRKVPRALPRIPPIHQSRF